MSGGAPSSDRHRTLMLRSVLKTRSISAKNPYRAVGARIFRKGEKFGLCPAGCPLFSLESLS